MASCWFQTITLPNIAGAAHKFAHIDVKLKGVIEIQNLPKVCVQVYSTYLLEIQVVLYIVLAYIDIEFKKID